MDGDLLNVEGVRDGSRGEGGGGGGPNAGLLGRMRSMRRSKTGTPGMGVQKSNGMKGAGGRRSAEPVDSSGGDLVLGSASSTPMLPSPVKREGAGEVRGEEGGDERPTGKMGAGLKVVVGGRRVSRRSSVRSHGSEMSEDDFQSASEGGVDSGGRDGMRTPAGSTKTLAESVGAPAESARSRA